ncbi:head-tail joining protein [Rhizobium mongolense]|uniref:Uncharacterized protein n=1 Tax=Rhizobium mongolense TaxID=57676 RepID=A0A7W6RQY1_9HYPH|nr:hypothetical protein [Rhizobium mongolense]MBB4277029.1 hypothetical protein [Rhizobium mongolense]
MPVETDDDRLIFVNPDEFGSVVVWTSATGQKLPVTCIFDDSFIALTAGDLDLETEGGRVQITLRSIDVPADAAHDDSVSVTSPIFGTKAYRVLEFQPDGTGMSTVRLQEPD